MGTVEPATRSVPSAVFSGSTMWSRRTPIHFALRVAPSVAETVERDAEPAGKKPVPAPKPSIKRLSVAEREETQRPSDPLLLPLWPPAWNSQEGGAQDEAAVGYPDVRGSDRSDESRLREPPRGVGMQAALAEKIPHLFTVAEYMALDIPAHTELIGGMIYDVSPKNAPHGFAIRRLNEALTPAIGKPGDPYEISLRDPIAVAGWEGPHSPEVDVAIIDRKSYTQTPNAADSHAFIEVSDTTYADDKKTKIPLYVAAKVPTWHVNIPDRLVEFHDRDAPLESPRIYDETETIDVLGVVIRVADLFEAPLERP
jgi:hypothetical protein